MRMAMMMMTLLGDDGHMGPFSGLKSSLSLFIQPKGGVGTRSISQHDDD